MINWNILKLTFELGIDTNVGIYYLTRLKILYLPAYKCCIDNR